MANHFVLLNIWFTPKDITQTIGRINRNGQTKPTYAYIFGNDGSYLLSDWDAEVPCVPKASSDMRKKIRLKKKSKSTNQKANSYFVPQGGIVETIPKTALLSPDMIPDLPEEDEVEVPDDIDDPGVDGPYLLSDWDAEVSGVPKTSSDMKGKIRLKKKSNSKNKKANSDFVPQGRKVEPIPKTAPPKALPPDTPPVAPKE